MLRRLDTSLAGLSSEEVAKRRALYGPNALKETRPIRPLTILAAQFRSLLIALLFVAGIVSGLLGEWLESAAIFAIVVLNGVIGFYQEWSAERSIAALRKLTAPLAKVRRSGAALSAPAAELVPGDVVLLEASDVVAADLRLLEAASLRCVEAALTGESEPVDKRPETLERLDLPLGDRANLAFTGTAVAAGTGLGVVVATGMATELGRIAELISEAATEAETTPLQRRLDAFGRVLVWGSLGIVLLLFVLGLLRELPAGELFLTSISLAVAAVPEGLSAVVTVALALGVVRMSRRRALVRRLAAVETLGSADVICTDKTGTLTLGEMTVRALYVDGQTFSVSGEGYGPDGAVRFQEREPDEVQVRLLRELLTVAVGCNDAHLTRRGTTWKVIGDPTEGAMLSAGAKLGILREELERETPRAGEWPFDPDRKRMSVARRLPAGQIRLLVKGAPDVLLERCDRVLTAKEVRSLTPEDRARISADQTRLAGRALRVLGVAWRDLALPVSPSLDAETVERELVFVGLIGMYDPPRPEAKKAVELCRSAGVRVVMITGDHPHTGLAVAREIGIATERETALGGTNLDRLSDAELAKRVPGIGVYARVTAGHKLRIVKAWKANGAVVAMTGDGVNDAPAIKGADIGIAMGLTGTEVTKEASDIVVTDDNFASIVAAVEEGRGIYDNIRKTLLYLLSGNAGELLLMTACITTGLPVPLLPIHLLWINLVTDGLPALCLATDPIDPDVMRRPPRPSTERLADRGFLTGMLLTGILTAGASLAVYLYGLRYEGPVEARTHAFATLVFAELLRSFSSRSETRPVWQVGVLSNLRLALVVLASFSLQIASHHLEPLRAVLKTAFLPWTECLALLGVALLPLAVLESLKVASRRPGAPAELAPTLNRPRGGAP